MMTAGEAKNLQRVAVATTQIGFEELDRLLKMAELA